MEYLAGVSIVRDNEADQLLITILNNDPTKPIAIEILNGNGEIVKAFHVLENIIPVPLGEFKKGNFSIRVTVNNNVYVKRI